ncbi:MAG: DUF932 domain-containing protein [Anaeromusa sp.]|uniref:DUF932 domain-containing protein n=1 Tax=Anaeromusa sp. TaxID=1872520 RepID=UPI002B1ED512|nr:DUF932 domain-containing protein [Anaeromusa sp.]MEA4834937.1 DUF932 domain-containing protein [Anaeromusa sp.]
MKQGRTIIQLAQELERQRQARKDFVADTRKLAVKTEQGQSLLEVVLPEGAEAFVVSELMHRQLGERLQIPQKYYQKMRGEDPELLDYNINRWFTKQPANRMVRTLDGKARAFLSDRYRRLDNLELADVVFPFIKDMKGAELSSCEVTESHMYVKVINKRLQAEVDVGDAVQAGMVISNSEVGLGSLKVEPLLFRLVCKNGLIVKDYAQKRYHVGRQIENDDAAYEIFSDETLAQDDKTFFMKVQDTLKTVVDETLFRLSVDKLCQSKQLPTGNNPVQTVEVLADRYLLSQNERGSILRHFIMSGDCSQYGLINAVTRASQDIEDYGRATEMERLGGELLASAASAVPTQRVVSKEETRPMKNITTLALAR